MRDPYGEEVFKGVSGHRRRLLAAVAAAGLTDEEARVFLCALEAGDLHELAWQLNQDPGEVRKLLKSAYRKIQRTGLIDESELPEVPGI